MTTERFGAVTLKGKPLTVQGDPVKVGDKAPNFVLTANDFSTVTLADSADKVRLISVVPSLDTGICDAQTRRFNEEAASLGDDVVIITVSAEHPFNQKRWCGAAGVDRVQVVSDHMDMNFGKAYGLAVKELRLEQRAIIVVDGKDTITYTEFVPEIAQHPDYEAALAAVRAAV
ncbi:MAG: thiol peroxidase [Anaerolineae bacterium]|nr:thiol peroxidase [Anaerolineae bacterium]MCO5199328.1 thiol peroxidase [Anaerolineae bacterium]